MNIQILHFNWMASHLKYTMSIYINVILRLYKYVCPGGVLRYISDGDVRSPFLGLKFAI